MKPITVPLRTSLLRDARLLVRWLEDQHPGVERPARLDESDCRLVFAGDSAAVHAQGHLCEVHDVNLLRAIDGVMGIDLTEVRDSFIYRDPAPNPQLGVGERTALAISTSDVTLARRLYGQELSVRFPVHTSAIWLRGIWQVSAGEGDTWIIEADARVESPVEDREN